MIRTSSRVPGPTGPTGPTGPSGASRAIDVRVATTYSISGSFLVDGANCDGVIVRTGDLALVHKQLANGGAANSIRVVPASGSAPRAPGFENYDDYPGIQVTVTEGDTYGGATFVCYSARGGTLDTTPILFAQAQPMQQLVYPREPMPADDGFMFVPPLYYFNRAVGFQLATPADNAHYWKVPVSASPTVAYRYYYDEAARLAGGTPIVTVVGTDSPDLSGWRKPLIATSLNGTVTSEHPVVGDRRGGIGRNQFMEGNDPDHAGFVYPNNGGVPVDVTDPDLIALGFTRGVKAPNSSYNSFYGYELPRKLKGGEFAFGRVRVQAHTPDEFGTPGLYVYRNDNSIGPLALTLEEKLSTTAAIYSVAGQLGSVAGADKIAIGSKGSAGNLVTVCGAQLCIDYQPVPWIARADFPTNDLPVPVLGPDLFLVKNRPLPLYVPCALTERFDDQTFVASLGSINAGSSNYPFERSGRQIMLEGEKMGASSTLVLHPVNRDLNRRSKLTFTNHIAEDSGHTATPKIHVIGDSITNRGRLTAVAAKLTALGVTPTWLGTINTSADSTTTGTGGPLAEAREGRGWSDLIYLILDGEATPLAPGDEATYLALTKTQKLAYNPYLRAATGGDDPSVIFNGYVFDFGFYWTRFSSPGMPFEGISGPNIVRISLGRNDELESSAAQALVNIQTAVPIVVASIRAADSSIEIGLDMSTTANTQAGRESYAESMALVSALNSYVRQLGDEKVYMVNTHAHVSPEQDWTMDSSPAVDAATGIQYAAIIDSIHGGTLNVEQMAEVDAAFIANVA